MPQSIPTVSLYLETGSIRIGTIIKMRRVLFLHYLAKLDKSQMLYTFFIAQWHKPVKSDWTEEVKCNLSEFDLPTELQILEQMSKNQLKKWVKKKVKWFEFHSLLELKMSRSKLKNLKYTELKMQEYLTLKTMDATEAKSMFKFRVRMAPFGEKYKGGQTLVMCPSV